MKKTKLMATIPHSGERVPEFCTWLQSLPEELLMCDVDRYVDRLYEGVLEKNSIRFIKTDWHRYAADLNRVPEDIDQDSVVGAPLAKGTHSRGFHWVKTTTEVPLMKNPMPMEMHQKLTQLVYDPFHAQIKDLYQSLRSEGAQQILHLDLHSMPSRGTKQHKDPGEYRADIVVSDVSGKSADRFWVDQVCSAYLRAGFKVAYNWPYVGGRVSEVYGHPERFEHCIQVELNRSLYMDETTKKMIPERAEKTKKALAQAIELIYKIVTA